MARQNVEIQAFNRGLISPLALARTDVARVKLMAEEMTNWIPRTLGPMGLRPGFGYLGATASNAAARYIPFVFAVDDTALIELTSGVMRVWVNDALVTRPAVSTAITNGEFTSDLTGWTDSDETGATSSWSPGGYLFLQGDGTQAAIREQQVICSGANVGVAHALRVRIFTGECYIRVGSSSGADDYVSETFLFPGDNSLSFTPTGNFFIRVFSRESYRTFIDSITIESAGVLSLPTPWTSDANLNSIRVDQSGDVLFVACDGSKPMRIERRSNDSWSVVEYVTDDGPFRAINTTPITIAASALNGSVSLTASKALFRSTNVGGLFACTSQGQNQTVSLSASDTYTDPIKVIGVGTTRAITRTISGTFVGTITLQRSVGDIGDWVDVGTYSLGTSTFNDGFDNQIIFYRYGFKTGQYTSGTASIVIKYAAGAVTGLARITSFTSSTLVNANVLRSFGSIEATRYWYEGSWSARRGYPSSVAFHEGRLWWAGKDRINGSSSDAFSTFDQDIEGDSAPISRSIGSGPVDTIRWLKAGHRLVIGAQGSELMARSSSLDEPLTPTNFNLKPASLKGSGSVDAVETDDGIVFVDRSGVRIQQMTADAYGNYTTSELSTIVPEIGEPGIVRTAIQRQPDTRMHFVRSDGKVAMLVYDKNEDVKCWCLVETDGLIEDVVVLPGTIEDNVYYVVARTIGGNTVRYLEKWAKWSECVGGTLNKQADSFITYTGAATASISGLTHLEGESVVCWADGIDQGTFTVASGAITLPSAVTNAVVGITYRARWKSTKLAYAAQGGSALTQIKRIDHLSLILSNTHAQGLKYGTSFDYLDDMPLREMGMDVDQDSIWATYDQHAFELNGTYDTDSRICLEANAPRPCTLLGIVFPVTTHEKI